MLLLETEKFSPARFSKEQDARFRRVCVLWWLVCERKGEESFCLFEILKPTQLSNLRWLSLELAPGRRGGGEGGVVVRVGKRVDLGFKLN